MVVPDAMTAAPADMPTVVVLDAVQALPAYGAAGIANPAVTVPKAAKPVTIKSFDPTEFGLTGCLNLAGKGLPRA